jgi:hypothetical protein
MPQLQVELVSMCHGAGLRLSWHSTRASNRHDRGGVSCCCCCHCRASSGNMHALPGTWTCACSVLRHYHDAAAAAACCPPFIVRTWVPSMARIWVPSSRAFGCGRAAIGRGCVCSCARLQVFQHAAAAAAVWLRAQAGGRGGGGAARFAKHAIPGGGGVNRGGGVPCSPQAPALRNSQPGSPGPPARCCCTSHSCGRGSCPDLSTSGKRAQRARHCC